MKALSTRMGTGTAAGRAVGMYAPFCGVVIAGCTNLLCMRNDELWHGVMVKDAEGNEHGTRMLTQGGQGGRPAPLALQFHRIPTHFLLNLHGFSRKLPTFGPPD